MLVVSIIICIKVLIFSVLRETLIFSVLRLGTRRRRRKTLLKKRKKRKKKKNGRYKNACVVIVKEGTREKRKIFFLGQEKNTLFSWGGGLDYQQSEALTLWPVFFCFHCHQVCGNFPLRRYRSEREKNFRPPSPLEGWWAGIGRQGRQERATARPWLYNKEGGCRRALRSLTPPGERARCVAPAAVRPGVAAVRSA